jgi:hypothetical protein
MLSKLSRSLGACPVECHFKNQIDAFNAYKKVKEEYIKEVAESYKHIIPEKAYYGLINYKVEITD